MVEDPIDSCWEGAEALEPPSDLTFEKSELLWAWLDQGRDAEDREWALLEDTLADPSHMGLLIRGYLFDHPERARKVAEFEVWASRQSPYTWGTLDSASGEELDLVLDAILGPCLSDWDKSTFREGLRAMVRTFDAKAFGELYMEVGRVIPIWEPRYGPFHLWASRKWGSL